MGTTAIEWTDKTWNPTVGCTRVSEGCRNCYAFTLHDRRHRAHQAGASLPAQYAKPFRELQLMPDRLTQPLKWRAPCRVFVNSMSDLFHKDVPDEFIDRVFAVMALAGRHTFQVLTKRPERMRAYLTAPDLGGRLYRVVSGWLDEGATGTLGRSWDAAHDLAGQATEGPGIYEWTSWRLPLPNVWLGTSVEDMAAAHRIEDLAYVPAAVRFLSCEPLLGPLDLRPWLEIATEAGIRRTLHSGWKPAIDWVIVGGESGANARPMHLDWARSLRDQCQAAGVPFFFKQWGNYGPGVESANPIYSTGEASGVHRRVEHAGRTALMVLSGKASAGRELDGRTWDEFPEVGS